MIKKIWSGLKRFKKKMAAKRRAFLKPRPHRSFKKTRPARTQPALVTVKQNTVDSFKTIWQERRLFTSLMVVYAIATAIFIGAIGQADFVELKEATLQVFGGSFDSVSTLITLLSSTMSGAFSTGLTELQQFLAIMLAASFWLSIIWALRMRFAEQKITMRDALYNSGAPLVSYVIVGFFIIMQLTPGAVGLFVLNVAMGGGFLQGGVEIMMFAVAAFLLCCLSIYWMSASITALVVVTLPQMYPWRAMQMASELAIGRRLRLVRHIVALAATLFVVWSVLLMIILILDAWLRFDWLPLLPVTVQVLSAWTVLYAATYIYRLYRSML